MDIQRVAEVKAAAGMTVASAAAALSWAAQANEIVQLLTALAALGVALLTARFYYLKGKILKAELRKMENAQDVSD